MVTGARPRAQSQGKSMIELVLVFCLSGSPGSCQEERPMVPDLSLVSGRTQGQQIAQDWLADPPKWTLSGWRCEANVARREPT